MCRSAYGDTTLCMESITALQDIVILCAERYNEYFKKHLPNLNLQFNLIKLFLGISIILFFHLFAGIKLFFIKSAVFLPSIFFHDFFMNTILNFKVFTLSYTFRRSVRDRLGQFYPEVGK